MRSLLSCISALILLASIVVADERTEKVEISNVVYTVPEYWCGRLIDSTLLAEPEQLVQLPDELTYEDYRIYILPETKNAFVTMAAAAKKDSMNLIVDSGFRSPGFQRRIIIRRLQRGDSIEEIFRSVAPPGYSEHHTGRALDLCPSEAKFAYKTEYFWLKENAADFGFIESLPEDSTNPGSWESWHWYYTGIR